MNMEHDTRSALFISLFLYFCCYAATQLDLQLHQDLTQVVCSNREAWKPCCLSWVSKTQPNQ